MRFLALLIAISASFSLLLSPGHAQAIEPLGRLDYRLVGQDGATVGPDGAWTISGAPGDSFLLSLTIEPRPSGRGTVLYPLSQLIVEKNVPNAHCVELQTIGADDSLDAWLDSSSFDYRYGDGVRAIGQYNGDAVNAGGELSTPDDLTKGPRLTLEFLLRIANYAKPGQYSLNLKLQRVYDGAERVDDNGRRMASKDQILKWNVTVEPKEDYGITVRNRSTDQPKVWDGSTNPPSYTDLPDSSRVGDLTSLSPSAEDRTMQLAMLTALVAEPLQVLINHVGASFMSEHPHFLVTPLYDDLDDGPGDFYEVMYIFDEADGSATVFKQLNDPSQNYPVRRMLMPVSLDMMGTPFTDDNLQLEVVPTQAPE